MTTPCYLIVHPRGLLMWDTGEISDEEITSDGTSVRRRSFTASRRLRDQLAEAGYTPGDITHLAFSHYHNDHVANAHLFAHATWLVQRAERKAMFDPAPDFERFGPITPDQRYFHKLRDSQTILIDNRDHDVFGDGTVVIKFTPGHTAGHQSLFVNLAESGPVLITGDLYHYYEEVSRPASFVNHVSNPIVSESRAMIEAFVAQTGADMWIPHDIRRAAEFRKAPAYYA
ncbi:MAG: N-acyl homoserine lactonase family protein [Alphaproteobacteria bacterium]|nr:MAG: N-acyl homoserine lactonase family protein [Alphaproteobacteria bacterium]